MIGFTLDGDAVVLAADGTESRVIADLARQLDAMLATRADVAAPDSAAGPAGLPDDPALARLLPDLIIDDAESARELRGLVEPSLIALKRENARLVIESLEHPGALGAETEDAWARLLTDLRLTIAARLSIDAADTELDAVSDTERDAAAHPERDRTLHEVYDWLGGVLEHLISTLDARDDRMATA